MEFTQMPSKGGCKYLLVFVDTSTGWVEAFPTRPEQATELCRWLLKEIISRFGLSKSLQGANGLSFTAKITQTLLTSLVMHYQLHSSCHPQSSGKVERMNQTLRRILEELCQETQEPWFKMLPIAFLRVRTARKGTQNLAHLR